MINSITFQVIDESIQHPVFMERVIAEDSSTPLDSLCLTLTVSISLSFEPKANIPYEILLTSTTLSPVLATNDNAMHSFSQKITARSLLHVRPRIR